jgi:hypothetical protein
MTNIDKTVTRMDRRNPTRTSEVEEKSLTRVILRKSKENKVTVRDGTPSENTKTTLTKDSASDVIVTINETIVRTCGRETAIVMKFTREREVDIYSCYGRRRTSTNVTRTMWTKRTRRDNKFMTIERVDGIKWTRKILERENLLFRREKRRRRSGGRSINRWGGRITNRWKRKIGRTREVDGKSTNQCRLLIVFICRR